MGSLFIYDMEDITARTEKKFIEASCDHGVRSDGRDLFDVRCMSVELGVLPQSNASCRLSIGTGTDLICSLKVVADVICYLFRCNES